MRRNRSSPVIAATAIRTNALTPRSASAVPAIRPAASGVPALTRGRPRLMIGIARHIETSDRPVRFTCWSSEKIPTPPTPSASATTFPRMRPAMSLAKLKVPPHAMLDPALRLIARASGTSREARRDRRGGRRREPRARGLPGPWRGLGRGRRTAPSWRLPRRRHPPAARPALRLPR